MPGPEKAKPIPLHELLGWTPPADTRTAAQAGRAPVAPRPGAPSAPASPAGGHAPDDEGGLDHDEHGAQAEQEEHADERGERRVALVDGSNVAHQGEGHGARLTNIIAVRDALIDQGYEPVVVVDAALRHQIDDVAGYERLVGSGIVKQAPAGTDADYFILAFAKHLDASIVSNDQFRDRSKQFAAVRRKVIRYMVLGDDVVFEKRTAKRRD